MDNVGLMAALAKAMAKAPTSEQVATAVTDWLDDHPEATTTVEDGSITNAKLASSFVTPGTAAAYSSSATYAVGDYCFHNGTLYRCTTPITTAETWTAAHWAVAVIGNDVSDLKSAIGEIRNEFDTEYTQIAAANITKTQGKRWVWDGGTELTETGATNNYAYAVEIEHGGPIDICGWSAGTNQGFCIYLFDENMNKLDAITNAVQITVDGEPYHTRFEAPYKTRYIHYTVYYNASAGLVYDKQMQGNVGDLKELDGVADKLDLLDEIVETVVSKNLFNPDTITTGFLLSSGAISTVGSYANYITSDFIEITPSTTYTFSMWSADYQSLITISREAGMLYDENKAIISNTYQNVNPASYLTFNNANAKYVRVCAPSTANYMVEQSATPTLFENYGSKDYSTLYVKESTMPYVNTLYGKKWAVCGDSFTNGATSTKIPHGQKYQGKNYTYPWIIGSRQNMDIVQFFLGGRTLAWPAEPGEFTNSLTNPNADYYYQNIPADVDYITLYLGINDSHHATGSSGGDGEDNTGEIPLGEITDNTTASYYGAWNVVLTWLITNRPNAHIGIIVTNGIQTNDNYRQAQIAIAEKYGIPYIDMNGDARTPAMLRTSNPNIADAVKTALIEKWRVSADNTHPNDAAHLFESVFIENFLRTL